MISNDHKFDMATAPKRDSRHWTADFVTWEELILWMSSPSDQKECGNYVLGRFRETTVTKDAPGTHPASVLPCTNLHRTKTAIELRGALTLDVDHPDEDFLMLVMGLECAYIVHTTYSSTEKEPRYRLILPLSRTVSPDEYHVAAAAMMQKLGEHNFDPGSVQPERYMFRPSAKRGQEFWYNVQVGPLSDVESLLEGFQADLSSVPLPKPHKNKRNPFEIAGPIGAFNRAYEDFPTLIAEFNLPYDEDGANRWHLTGAAAAAGMGEVAPGLVFSHHANDPAYGQTCSAFDLVRLHLFGELDDAAKPGTPINKLPSTTAMLELATTDLRVVQEIVGDDFSTDMTATADAITTDNWRLGFALNSRTGQPTDDIRNWDLIFSNDPAITGLYYNELSMSVECRNDLPWRKVDEDSKMFRPGDRSALMMYIDRTYHIRPSAAWLDHLIAERVNTRMVNPVRDYLRGLRWDGTSRIEEALPGVRPTEYTRMVARKSLVAAVARMLKPGIKWDHMLVLHGDEGLGKSWWVERMSRGFSANLGSITDKDVLVTMRRSWILTADEGHNLRKADFDAQKEFITRTADVFRMPYDREAQVYQRHCVIWGTTNDDVFLTKQKGNRRFLIVTCEDKVDFDLMTDEYVDQVWAEAVHLYEAGEPLWLNEQQSALAAGEREWYTEENPNEGLVAKYLDRLVPEDWDSRTVVQRQEWLFNRDQGLEAEGTKRIDSVCSKQLWVEALGRRYGEQRVGDLRPLAEILKGLPGWVRMPGRPDCGPYGQQLTFCRIESLDGGDLI